MKLLRGDDKVDELDDDEDEEEDDDDEVEGDNEAESIDAGGDTTEGTVADGADDC